MVNTFYKENQNQQTLEDACVSSEKSLKDLSKCGNLAGDNNVQIVWICWMVLELSQTEEQSSISNCQRIIQSLGTPTNFLFPRGSGPEPTMIYMSGKL